MILITSGTDTEVDRQPEDPLLPDRDVMVTDPFQTIRKPATVLCQQSVAAAPSRSLSPDTFEKRLGWKSALLTAGLVLSCVFNSAVVRAQPGDSPGTSLPATSAETPSSRSPGTEPTVGPRPLEGLLGTIRQDIIYLPDSNGKLVPVPVGVTLKDYLDWLQKREQGDDHPEPANSGLTHLHLTGAVVDDDRALLTAKIGLQVLKTDDWVRVALQMPEAVLRNSSYKGPGSAVPDRFDPETGYWWWVKGTGQHELTLSITVPLRKQLPGRRLQLTLPPTAVSSLLLKVPHQRVTARVTERSAVSTKAAGKETEIEVFGLGTRLDLTWQPVESVAADTVLDALTAISASLVDGESMTLEVTQTIRALQGSFDEVRVRLPAFCELLRVDGSEYESHSVDPKNVNQISVKLKKTTAGPIELRWTARTKLPAPGAAVALDGFQVDRARVQTGFIALGVVGDYRMMKQPAEDRFIQRINLADLPAALRQSQIVAGYRFLNQPFRLVFNLQRVEPYLTVTPYQLLHFTPESVELDCLLQYQVFRGSVEEVILRWPNWKKNGWIIDPGVAPGPVEEIIAGDPRNPDWIRIRFVEPVKGNVDVRLHARRMVSLDKGPLNLLLPEPIASNQSPTILTVSTADNIELSFDAVGMTVIRPLVGQALSKLPLPRDTTRFRHLSYQVDSVQHEFSAMLRLHPREVRAHTTVRASGSHDGVTVRERIFYDVTYDRLSQVNLRIGSAIRSDQIKFYSESGVELTPVWGKAGEGQIRELRLPLEEPHLGRFEIEARYTLTDGLRAVPTGQTCQVPLIQSADAAFESLRFEWSDTAGRDAIIGDASWTRQPTVDGSYVWTTTTPQPSVELDLSHERAVGGGGLVIPKALLRTIVDHEGGMQNRAQYQIQGPLPMLVVEFAEGQRPTTFWWDQERIEPQSVAGSHRYELFLPDHPGLTQHLLTIDYHGQGGTPVHFTRKLELPLPRIAGETWVTQMLWELTLPPAQHLFAPPKDFTPEYRWEFGGLFWRRSANRSPQELREWINATDGPRQLPITNSEHRYLFSRFGATEQVSLRTMTQSGLVLVGAGLAFALGLLLVKVPVTRHALTVLAVGLTFSLIGLWFPGPLLLLLQPAVLGIVLALVAVTIDVMVKRRRRPAAVTLSSPSGFMTTPAPMSHEISVGVGVGSEEYTSVRPALSVVNGGDAGSDSGSGSRRP